MLKVFGRKLCSACQEKKAELDSLGIEYQYYDLDTAEGLAEAAYLGILGKDVILPVVVESSKNNKTIKLNEK